MNRELDRGEIQDRLPDLARGTLSAEERAVVEAAVRADADLARELEIVRAARRALTPTVAAIDADRVVSAVRRPAGGGASRAMRWRIAAAIATVAIGGASLAVVQRAFRGPNGADVLSESTQVAPAKSLEISFGYDLSSLGDEELNKLVTDLEKSGGVPSEEPRKIVPPVSPEGTQ